jgi:hypothetical protein
VVWHIQHLLGRSKTFIGAFPSKLPRLKEKSPQRVLRVPPATPSSFCVAVLRSFTIDIGELSSLSRAGDLTKAESSQVEKPHSRSYAQALGGAISKKATGKCETAGL